MVMFVIKYFYFPNSFIFNKMRIFTVLLIIGTFLHTTKASWIDPHSMDTNSKNKLPNRSTNIHGENSEKCIPSIKHDCVSDLHLRRIVRLILNNAYLGDEMGFGYHEGHLNIKLSAKEYKVLVAFSQSTDTGEDISGEISSIFENALQKSSVDKYGEIFMSVQDKLYGFIFNPTSAALTGTCFALYVTYKLLRAQFTWTSIIVYFLYLLYIADFIITYLHIIQEEEINNMVLIKKLGSVPPECDPQKMTWWMYMKTQFESTFSENPCKSYYQATFQNYKYLITPSKVFTRQFRTIIVEPCGDIGEAFGKFGRSLFTSLPWGLNVVLFPVMLISACIIFFMIFLFITKPQFKLSLFHLFSIELGGPVRGETRRAISNSNQSNGRELEYVPNHRARRRRNRDNGREVGVTENHRMLVEDVSNDNSSSHGSELDNTNAENVSDEEYSQEEAEKLHEDEDIKNKSTSNSESFTEL